MMRGGHHEHCYRSSFPRRRCIQRAGPRGSSTAARSAHVGLNGPVKRCRLTSRHHCCRLIFGRPASAIYGPAPHSGDLVIPVFGDESGAQLARVDLAWTIEKAVQASRNRPARAESLYRTMGSGVHPGEDCGAYTLGVTQLAGLQLSDHRSRGRPGQGVFSRRLA